MPSTFTMTCPHCHAEHMTFTIFGASLLTGERPIGRLPLVSAAGDCKRCGAPVAIQLMTMVFEQAPHEALAQITLLHSRSDDVLQAGFQISSSWPEPKSITIPSHLPAGVERAFLQAERNHQMDGCEEPAALMYRRALELALNELHPQTTGSLAARIRQLVTQHHLPGPIGDWLNQVRLIGNEGAHDAEVMTRDKLDDARAFTDTALRYLYTLPAQIASRRTINQDA